MANGIIFIMKSVLVAADSRGSRLDSHLKEFNSSEISFIVHSKKGAGLLDIWNTVEPMIKEYSVNLVFIMGGICDVTDLFVNIQGK